MSRLVLLDTSVLSSLLHPSEDPAILAWYEGCVRAGDTFCVPELADYELRRELLRARKSSSVARLDAYCSTVVYLPITTATMRTAALLWAEARQRGKPTGPDDSLDGDAILAAQARHCETPDTPVIVATTNVKHLSQFVKSCLLDRPQCLPL